MVFFITAILLCSFTLFYVVRLNIEQGRHLRDWEWIDWMRIVVALYWIFISGKLLLDYTLGSSAHTFIYPGVILTLALVAGSSIRKEKRVNGNVNGKS